jgi:hypothetical protein
MTASSRIVFADNNYNTVRISPVQRESDGYIETTVVFSATLYDDNNNPVAGATALSTAYRTGKQDNAVILPVSLAAGNYTLTAAATGAFAGLIKFTSIPIIAILRQ